LHPTSMTILDRPNRFPWPPILTVVAFVAGFISRAFIPDFGPSATQWIIGLLIAAGGALLVAYAFVTFARGKTNIMPNRAAGTLLTSGAFRISRNPIYTGEVLGVFGVGIALGAPGMMIAALLLAFALLQLGILREEAHLEARFGDEWRAYRSKVRRWL
jgi:protein-S-isoprenylcysteine O-methyltransferase Ste14